MATQTDKGIPVVREERVLKEHIPFAYAGSDQGWVLINVGDGKFAVAETYDSSTGGTLYDVAHGPFSYDEILDGLTRISRQKPKPDPYYNGAESEWDDFTANGVVFRAVGTPNRDPRVMVKTGDDEVTIWAWCGEYHEFVLSKLRQILRLSRTLAVVECH